MDTHDIARLNVRLQKLYGERFLGLTLSMAELWLEDLRHIPADIVHYAVKRWAREHTHRAPSLEDLGGLIDAIRTEQRRAVHPPRVQDSATHDDETPRGTPEEYATNVQELIASIWPDLERQTVPGPQGKPQPLHPAYTRPVADPEARKAQLLDQLAQLQDDQWPVERKG